MYNAGLPCPLPNFPTSRSALRLHPVRPAVDASVSRSALCIRPGPAYTPLPSQARINAPSRPLSPQSSSKHSRNLPEKSPHYRSINHGSTCTGCSSSFGSWYGMLFCRLRGLLSQLALGLRRLLPLYVGYAAQLGALAGLSSLPTAEVMPFPAI